VKKLSDFGLEREREICLTLLNTMFEEVKMILFWQQKERRVCLTMLPMTKIM
jgi:hypothetical protein